MITTAWLTIGTDQFTAVVDFYRTVLRQTPQPFTPERYAEFQLPGLRLGIFRPQTDHQGEFSQSAQSGFSLCLEVEDLATAIANFQAGAPAVSLGQIQTAAHGQEIYVYDPAGNRLILHQKHSH